MWVLLGYHVMLILTNQTTNEYLKKYSTNHPHNPFHGSFIKNLKKFCTSRKKKGHFGHSVYRESPPMYVTGFLGANKDAMVTVQSMQDVSPSKAIKFD